MQKTETNTNTFKEKTFATAATKEFIGKYNQEAFIREHVLPNLYKQAAVHFGNENWYTISFDHYLKDDWHYFTITCQGK